MSISPGTTTSPLGTSTTFAPSDRQIASDARDAIAVDQQIEHAVTAVRRIDDAPASQQRLRHRLLIALQT